MMDRDRYSQYICPMSPVPTSIFPEGTLNNKIRCVLFDIYGTLFISGSGDVGTAKKMSAKVMNYKELFARFNIDRDPEAISSDFFSAIESSHTRLKQQGIRHPEIEVDRIWMDVLGIDDLETLKRFAVEYELITNPVYPFPHLDEMLSAMAREGVLMGIISNAQFYTEYLFHWFLGSGPEDLGFQSDLIFYSYKTGRAKPSDFMFQAADNKLQCLDILPHSVLYVGNDMLNDICPAQKTGFKTALFAGDTRSLRLRKNNPDCKNISPDIIITDLSQLIDHIKSANSLFD
jgi:putative hydrolase of the HAD superfamily